MPDTLSVQQLYDSYSKSLKLDWISGKDSNSSIINDDDDKVGAALLVGYLNLVRPSRIQVLGKQELDYLSQLGKNSRQDSLERLFQQQPATIIFVDNITIPEDIHQQAEAHGIPLFSSRMSGDKLIEHLRHYLKQKTSDKATRHGVFMDVMGIGVLITGPSGIGKSELALELITRGHRLIADDAPEFKRMSPNNIRGYCPEVLADFLEVRGLGILNLRAMFGDNALIRYKRLRLVINLEQMSDKDIKSLDRLGSTHCFQNILDVNIPEVVIPVAPGRNLAVIVEAAVRNHLLDMNGYRAADDFINRQQELISKKD